MTCDIERRAFVSACSASLVAMASQFAVVSTIQARDSGASKRYMTSILTDEYSRPIRVAALKPRINYLFHYPYVATPCLLIDLGRDIGGVGPRRSIVAFSAICTHKLAYPAREVSFIRFQPDASSRSEAERIHCCADHSVYDPALGAKVVAGPAPEPLTTISLDYDHRTDALRAVGTVGVEQFAAFFAKYEFKLALEFGGAAQRPASGSVRLQELTQFCRNVAQC